MAKQAGFLAEPAEGPLRRESEHTGARPAETSPLFSKSAPGPAGPSKAQLPPIQAEETTWIPPGALTSTVPAQERTPFPIREWASTLVWVGVQWQFVSLR